MNLEFDLSRIEDPAARSALQRVRDVLRASILFNGEWVFLEMTFINAGTNTTYKHGLNFTPKDVIQVYTSVENGVIWNYDLFDSTNINLDVMIPCTIRAFIGRYTP